MDGEMPGVQPPAMQQTNVGITPGATGYETGPMPKMYQRDGTEASNQVEIARMELYQRNATPDRLEGSQRMSEASRADSQAPMMRQV